MTASCLTNLSGLDAADVQAMTEQLRRGLGGGPGMGHAGKDKPPIPGRVMRR